MSRTFLYFKFVSIHFIKKNGVSQPKEEQQDFSIRSPTDEQTYQVYKQLEKSSWLVLASNFCKILPPSFLFSMHSLYQVTELFILSHQIPSKNRTNFSLKRWTLLCTSMSLCHKTLLLLIQFKRWCKINLLLASYP